MQSEGDPSEKKPKSLEIPALALVPATVYGEPLPITIGFCTGGSGGEAEQAAGRTEVLPDHELPQ